MLQQPFDHVLGVLLETTLPRNQPLQQYGIRRHVWTASADQGNSGLALASFPKFVVC